ncbi:MAG: iron-sulfur cluster insertion protein ErpA [Pseudomonadales bacterium]
MQANIQFSDRAAAKVRTLIEAEGDEELRLRVFVTGGGCNGFSYGFTFDDDVAEDDAMVENEGVAMVIDSMSYPYLEGSEVDYVEDLNGSQFVVSNPNAQSTCGCGNSFAI